MTTEYISAVDTAKLVREALEKHFRGQKFSVRTSGHNCINIRWIDGPTTTLVDEVVNRFKGADFDGMTDSRNSRMGRLKGKDVRFMADFIFTNRDFSEPFLRAVAEKVCEKWGEPMPEIKLHSDKTAYVVEEWHNRPGGGMRTLSELIYIEARETSSRDMREALAEHTAQQAVGDGAYKLEYTTRDGQAPWTWLTLAAEPAGSLLESLAQLGFAKSAKRSAIKKASVWYAKQEVSTETFADIWMVYQNETTPLAAAQQQTERERQAERMRNLAENRLDDASDKRHSAYTGLRNTRRRINIGSGLIYDAERLERLAGVLMGIGQAAEDDTMPEVLRYVTTQRVVNILLSYQDMPSDDREWAEADRASLIRAQIHSRNYHEARAAVLELDQQIQNESPMQRRLRELNWAMVGNWPAGYFPTPTQLVRDVLMPLADVKPGLRWLEPSAGSGHIADVIRDHCQPHTLDLYEIDHRLFEILTLKGYFPSPVDFLRAPFSPPSPLTGYDRIVMNPPFENGQDIDHVMHAYQHLKIGGRLVAIMGEGAFHRSDRKALTFRSWLREVRGVNQRLPEGSFKSSAHPTGVHTRIVACVRIR